MLYCIRRADRRSRMEGGGGDKNHVLLCKNNNKYIHIFANKHPLHQLLNVDVELITSLNEVSCDIMVFKNHVLLCKNNNKYINIFANKHPLHQLLNVDVELITSLNEVSCDIMVWF